MANSIHKILLIGNAAGGKTVLSQRLGEIHKIPITHVDSLQFLPGLQLRPYSETLKMIAAVTQKPTWIIDGFGPLDDLQERMALADRVIFIDLPLWRHYWWFAKRQLQSLWHQRPELPENSKEWKLQHSMKVAQNITKVHKLMRPELLRILALPNYEKKVIHVREMKTWNALYKNGIQN